MELFKFIRLGIIFIGVGLSNCSTPGEYKIQGTATGIGQGMVCIISYLDKKADTLAKAEIKEEKFELKGKVSNLTIATLQIPGKGIGHAPIYLENTDYTVRLNPQNLEMSEIIGGGESQKIAHGLFLIDQNLSQAIDSIRDEYIKEAKIGRAVMDADVFISLTHFKGHESTGFGGAIKNIGMGCGSRAGKMQQHASGKPSVREKLCRGCRRCAKECGSDAITYVNKKAVIDYDKCKGCGRCIGACSFDAIYNPNYNANELLDRKMAEYAQAVCYDRPCFHISLVQDISPNCDCHGENDAPILPDIGMFASFDPVALDQACADACLKAAPIANSQLGEHLSQPGWHCHHDHFKDSNPNIEWQATLDQAEKIGLGTRQYELKRI